MKVDDIRKEPKWKLGALGVLGLVLLYFVYSAFQGDAPPSTAASTPRPAVKADSTQASDAVLDRATPAADSRSRRGSRSEPRRLQFALKEKADPTTIDPTLRSDLLAKLHAVTIEGGDRNLFTFGSAPLPKTPENKINVSALPAQQPPPQPMGPTLPPQPPPPPPPPQIPLKFYGYASRAGVKRAFFLQGDEIYVAGEGEIVQKRYKVVKIGVNNCVMEDSQFKNNQQTLPLVEEQQPG